MSYRTKYFISLGVLVVGSMLVIQAANELYGSFGNAEIIRPGAWKLGIGFVVVAVSAPLFNYFRARKKQTIRPEDAEVEMLAKLGEARLKEQEKYEDDGHR